MKRIRTDYIVIHCSNTYAGEDLDRAEMHRRHTDPYPFGNGWADIGYHFIIRRNGRVEKGLPMHKIGRHARGLNTHSLGVCLIGGRGEDGRGCNNFTLRQFIALRELLHDLKKEFPRAEIFGYRDLSGPDGAPWFDVRAWLANPDAEFSEIKRLAA